MGSSRFRALLFGALLIEAAFAVWLFRREIAYGITAFLDLFRSAIAPPGRWHDRTIHADAVDASAFAPDECAPGETVLVQVFFHRRSSASTVRKRAQEADSEATRRTFCTFETAVRRGQRLGVKLEAPGLSNDEAEQSVVWHGDPCMCQFSLNLPDDAAARGYVIIANFFLDGVPIGLLRFKLDVVLRPHVSRMPRLYGDAARHFKQAFLSYSSHDREAVLQCAQVLENVGIDFFLDAVSLRGGEIWERRLFEEIDRSDLFLLFW
jgi:hypothetical protein